jgi:exodeoxyribonuclease V gamma subunit
MRSVPYRVVCLVGMEHDRFPRSSRSDGDDLLLGSEAVGDRDRGAEDRQLLLDALMAAGDYFVLAYTGRDPLTNTEQPLAVPIAELYEVIETMVGVDEAKRIRTDHPLQSFSPEVFTNQRLGVAGPWGYDPTQHSGAAVVAQRVIDGEDESGPVFDPVEVEPPALARLIKYLANPSATYLRDSLGMFVPDMDGIPNDELPIALSGLEQWSVTTRMLDGISSGHDEMALAAYERGADNVPAGKLADDPLDDALALARRLERIARERGWVPGTAVPFAGTVVIDGEEFAGSVLGDPDEALVTDVSPSRPKASRWTSLYARTAFLSALDPERPWRGLLVGKKDNKGAVTVVTFGPFGDDPEERAAQGRQRLAALTELFGEGMTVPVPLFPEASLAWRAAKPGKGKSPARSKWVGYEREGIPGERDHPAIGVLFPHLFEPNDLFESEFELYADRLWLAIQQVADEETVRPKKEPV